MQLIDSSSVAALCSPSVATIGFFDGVHRGHRFLIQQVQQAARQRNLATSVITFPEHPRKVMQTDYQPELLSTAEEKISLLAETGVEQCILLPFTLELAKLSAYQFMQLLKEQYHVEVLVIGYDHRFGHNRCESFCDYVRYSNELGIEVLPAQPLSEKEEDEVYTISSSLVRRLLQQGDVENANRFLGYTYFLEGIVSNGFQVGRTIGFPTANLRVENPNRLVPKDGVYAVFAQVNGVQYGGMLSIGFRPTIGNGTHRSIEVHLFHFNEDIYECSMRIYFVKRTRSEIKFTGLESLIRQLHQDEQEIKAILKMID